MFDTVLSGGCVVDPRTLSNRLLDVGIQDGRIAAIARGPLPGREVIDATGRIVCPGFIDVHGHLDGDAYAGELSLRQGITTTVGGNCGFSPCDLEAFFRREDERGYVIRQAEMVGHSGTLRNLVGLTDTRTPASPEQIERMCALLERAFDAGACGLSLGLGYAPGSSMDEVLPLCQIAAARGRVVSIDTHMRTQTDLYSLVEAVSIARATGARMLISHFVYQYGVGVEDEAMALVDCARRAGLDIRMDSGMYTDWATGISTALFDRDIMEDNNIELWHIRMATGEHRGQVLDEALYEHVRREHADDSAIVFTGDEEAIYRILRHPLAMPSTDAGAYRPGEGHPQIAGSFPRYLRKMVVERGDLTWEEAIFRATLLPAQTIGLPGVGRMEVGAAADLVVFDPQTIRDRATFVGLGRPNASPEGIDHVFIGGVRALSHGCIRCRTAGRPLRF